MQDPKQKAQELVEKFYQIIDKQTTATYEIKMEAAKQCAVMACNLSQESPCNFEWYNRYLEEVKQEIINL